MIGRVIVALNIGNTHIGYGFVEAGAITSTGSVPTPSADRLFELEIVIDEALGQASATDGTEPELIVASVVPMLTEELRSIATRRGFRLVEADETTLPVGTAVDAGTAGHDRLVNAFAAARLYGTPAIVVDLGTATTFDVVDNDGQFVGGAIAPGVGLGLDALASRTAQLPHVRLALPPRALGRDTIEAIQSGTVLGHVGMVEYLVRAITAELSGGPTPKVILTGGLSSHPWAKRISGVDAIDPLLTLRGLALLHAQRSRVESVAQA
jgi:type III pantothenate kinase